MTDSDHRNDDPRDGALPLEASLEATTDGTPSKPPQRKWRPGPDEVLPQTERRPVPILSLLAALFLRTTGVGMGLGLLHVLLLVPDLAQFSSTNALEPKLRNPALNWMLGWLILTWLGWGVWLLFHRSRSSLEKCVRVAAALGPLAWLWPLPLYLDWRIFQGNGLVRVVLALIWVLCLERSFRATFLLAERPLARVRGWLSQRWSNWAGLALVGGFALWFAIFCSHYSIMQHQRMGTTAFDLGIFDNLMFNLMKGEWFRGGVDVLNEPGTNHLQFHANFLAYLFVPIYMISPRAETMLIIQAWVVGLSAVPLYLLVQHRLNNAIAAAVLSIVYLSHEALQGPVFYDFHFLTLAPFFIGWTLYFFERGWRWPLAISWVITVLLREEMGALIGGALLTYLLMGKRPWVALVGGLLGLGWLALMRFYVMPLHAAKNFDQHVGYFHAMVAPGEHGYGGVLKSMLSNPVFTLENLLEAKKLEYLLQLMVPFALLPVRSLRQLFMFVFAAMLTLGTTKYPPPISKGFQYTMFWMPLLIVASAIYLSGWKKALPHRISAAVAAIFVVGMSLGVNGGALYQQNSFTGGFRRIVFEMSEYEVGRYEELRELLKLVPPEASVTATESVVPHLSNRRDAHTVRQGLGDFEYLVLWHHELRGGQQLDNFVKGLGKFGAQRYGVIAQGKEFQVWKRGAPQTDNRKALRALGLERRAEFRPERADKHKKR